VIWAVISTADLLDEHGAEAAVCLLQFRGFGAPAFAGRVATVRCPEDNVLLRRRLDEPGDGRVLVVDGGGSFRCALVGDNLGRLALESGWAGLVINGCVRDSAVLDALGLGMRALGTNPRPSRKEGTGEVETAVTFGGVTFEPDAMLYVDEDGVVVLS
jgi:regulator of ribonuclease activity A